MFSLVVKKQVKYLPVVFLCVFILKKSGQNFLSLQWVTLSEKKNDFWFVKKFLEKKEVSRLFQKVQMIHTQFDPRKKISEFLITVLYFRICYESQRYENKGFWLVGKVLNKKMRLFKWLNPCSWLRWVTQSSYVCFCGPSLM